MVKELQINEFNEAIKEGKVLIDCYATWCGPCRMLAPIIEELSNEITEYKFYKLDVDNNEDIARQFGIMSIPTLLIFDQGELKQKLVGLISKEELKKVLN